MTSLYKYMQRIQVEKDSQAKAKLAYFFSIIVIAIRAPSVQESGGKTIQNTHLYL